VNATRRPSPWPLGPLLDLARALRLYVPTLVAPRLIIFGSVLLPGLLFSFERPGSGESQSVLLRIGVAFFCFGLAQLPLFMMRDRRPDTIAFLETRALRAPTKMLVLVPLYAIAALYAAALGAYRHFSIPEILAVAGCCAWAVAVGMLSPPPGFSKATARICLLIVGTVVAVFAHGSGGWPSCAIAMGALAIGGAIAIPRGVASRYEVQQKPATKRATEPRVRDDLARPERFARRRTGTTWFDVLRLVGTSGQPLALRLLVLQILILSVVTGVVLKNHDGLGALCAMWMLAVMGFANALAAGLSRPTFEFLATRPLGPRRLVLGTIVPWLLLALSLPLVLFLWAPRGFVSFGRSHVSVTSLELRLVLVSLACLFCFAHHNLLAHGERRSVANVGAWLGFIAVALPFFFPYRVLPAPWPLPPVGLLTTYTLVLGAMWYRRLPWHLLSSRAAR
jgi:hypothetical protein